MALAMVVPKRQELGPGKSKKVQINSLWFLVGTIVPESTGCQGHIPILSHQDSSRWGCNSPSEFPEQKKWFGINSRLWSTCE